MPPSASVDTLEFSPPRVGATHEIQRVLDALPGGTEITITISFTHRTPANGPGDLPAAAAGSWPRAGGAAPSSLGVHGPRRTMEPDTRRSDESLARLSPIAAVEKVRWTDDQPRITRDWAPLLNGISARELTRAVSAGAIPYTRRANSRGHRGKLVAPIDLLAYLRQREAVLSGREAEPAWFGTVVHGGM